MSLSKLKLLVNLARIDGEVADQERNYIINIGKANGLENDQVVGLLDSNHEVIVPSNLTNDQRFDYIFSLVQLMKIDQRLYSDEIRFCSTIAARLGYDHTVMFEMLLHVRPGMQQSDVDSLKNLAAKYLQPG